MAIGRSGVVPGQHAPPASRPPLGMRATILLVMLTAIHPLGSAQLKLLLPLGSESLRRPNEGWTEVTSFWIKTFSGW